MRKREIANRVRVLLGSYLKKVHSHVSFYAGKIRQGHGASINMSYSIC